MTSFQIETPEIFSNSAHFEVSTSILDDLSRFKFIGKGGITLLKHTIYFTSFCDRHDILSGNMTCGFFSLTFEGGAKINGVTHSPQPLYTLLVSFLENHVVISFFMTIKPLIEKNLNFENRPMNLFNIFTIVFFIDVWNFLKISLTRNSWMKYFNILFTFSKVHMS